MVIFSIFLFQSSPLILCSRLTEHTGLSIPMPFSSCNVRRMGFCIFVIKKCMEIAENMFSKATRAALKITIFCAHHRSVNELQRASGSLAFGVVAYNSPFDLWPRAHDTHYFQRKSTGTLIGLTTSNVSTTMTVIIHPECIPLTWGGQLI